jgi:hypothetical protein
MNRKKLTIIAVAVLAAATVASAALAAPGAKKPLTGVWSGKTQQVLEPLSDGGDFVDWSQRVTIRALNGRLTYVGTSVRYTCPDPTNPMAGDIPINLSWKSGRGPLLSKNGGFSLVVTHVTNLLTGKEVKIYAPVHLTGVLGAKGASGGLNLSRGGCSGKGQWQAKRTF